jgi:hypothetical protein
VRNWVRKLHRRLAALDGVTIEDKTLATIHFRRAKQKTAQTGGRLCGQRCEERG